MQEYTLARTGERPLEFTGTLLVEEKSPAYRRHENRKSEKTRCHWFEVAIYRTKGGKFVLRTAYRFSGPANREEPQDFVQVYTSETEMLDDLNAFDPTRCVGGFPEGEHWEEKQRTLMESIEHDYTLLVEKVETKFKEKSGPERIE